MQQLLDNLFLFRDTCNVYVMRAGREVVLIDFGSGDVLDHLGEIGVERATDVLMTHHHRDQAQGLFRAAAAGIRVWVPHTEQDLFHSVDAHWQAREVYNNYNMRQDRFSLLEPVHIDGTLKDYATHTFGGYSVTIVPTPGHTIGSITLLADIDGQKVAFSGDLIAAPGSVWNLASTQWSYNGAEGVAASVLSLLDLKERHLIRLLPSHGEPMDDPDAAIDLLVSRLWELLRLRQDNPRLLQFREQPFERITPHLLMNRTSVASQYVLISRSGKALMIDFGYDFVVGFPLGVDRASRRPWLYNLLALKRQYGVSSIEVVLPTHYHDDHVAGLNLLRDVEGAQVWAAELFADTLEQPSRYDLPCLWYDPIPVDRRLPLETPVQWEEYTFTLYALPGHTFYAVAIAFEADGYRVLAGGDQYGGDDGPLANYVYPNRFRGSDYALSADLYNELRPDVIVTGHWQPRWTTRQYFDQLQTLGRDLQRLHRELQPPAPLLRDEAFLARITPYQLTAHSGETLTFETEIYNPYPEAADVLVQVVVPAGWRVGNADLSARIGPFAVETVTFQVIPAGEPIRRARIAVEVTIGGQRFGQQAEALVTVE